MLFLILLCPLQLPALITSARTPALRCTSTIIRGWISRVCKWGQATTPHIALFSPFGELHSLCVPLHTRYTLWLYDCARVLQEHKSRGSGASTLSASELLAGLTAHTSPNSALPSAASGSPASTQASAPASRFARRSELSGERVEARADSAYLSTGSTTASLASSTYGDFAYTSTSRPRTLFTEYWWLSSWLLYTTC